MGFSLKSFLPPLPGISKSSGSGIGALLPPLIPPIPKLTSSSSSGSSLVPPLIPPLPFVTGTGLTFQKPNSTPAAAPVGAAVAAPKVDPNSVVTASGEVITTKPGATLQYPVTGTGTPASAPTPAVSASAPVAATPAAQTGVTQQTSTTPVQASDAAAASAPEQIMSPTDRVAKAVNKPISSINAATERANKFINKYANEFLAPNLGGITFGGF